jgi:hypothetical protein
MYAWVLIMGMAMNYSVAIPGIVSQAECERLAKEIPIYGIGGHGCYRYQIAK